jgi:hypothetical protein
MTWSHKSLNYRDTCIKWMSAGGILWGTTIQQSK